MRRKTPLSQQAHNEPPRPVRSHGDIRWEKLDNTAHLFPVIAGENASNVYRVSVTLRELVDPQLLQQALDCLLPRFDGFNMRMRQGVFWYYFEENGKSAPRVQEEEQFPCRYIRANNNNHYLFRVSYYKYRINLEVFHALSDGMGGFNFLKELTYSYLRLAHPDLMSQTGEHMSFGTTLNREDSFLKNYRKPAPHSYKTRRAWRIRGEKLRSGEFGVMHGYLNLPQLKALCRQQGLTINEYLVSVYVWSIYTECLHSSPSKKPVRIAIPVNLRPYFNSTTTKNFFVIISAEFHPTREKYSFEEIRDCVTGELRSQLKSENLEEIFSYNVSTQKSPFIRILPLGLKNLAMRCVYLRSAYANTSTISNVGTVQVPELYKPYIELFHGYMAVSAGQPIKGTVCSYGDTLVFSFSSELAGADIQRGFFRKLSEDGLEVEIESNGVYYG